jgi:hypothetical protein
MGDRAAVEAAIGNALRDLPGKLHQLRHLATMVGDPRSG